MVSESTSSDPAQGVSGAAYTALGTASGVGSVQVVRRRPGVSLALQAGGASRRMGIDKATAELVEGVSVLEWLRDRVAHLFEDAFIVANEPVRFRRFGLPVVTDALGERGSVVGVYTSLLASPTERVLCLACDMPFVTADLLRALVDGSASYDVYVPRHGPYLQPLCAVYAVAVAGAFEEFMGAGGRRIDAVYQRLHTGYLDVGDGRFGDPEELFLNTNTPEELEQARRLAREPIIREATRRSGATAPSVAPADPANGQLRQGALATAGSETDGTPAHGAARPVQKADASGISADVRAFVARAPFPVVSFVGKKKTGKTTVLVGVVEELTRRGWRLAVVKHDSHGFDPDVPGTDSYRLRHAGAAVTGISSPDLYMWITRTDAEPSLEELMTHLTLPVDLLITEGFKLQPAPKIEVSRRERSTELIGAEDELVGVVSDQRFTEYSVPQLDLDDYVGIADLVERRVMALWSGRHPVADVASAEPPRSASRGAGKP